MPRVARKNQPIAGRQTIADATCLMCGCTCDDMDLTVEDGQIVGARGACELGAPWFLGHRDGGYPQCQMDGHEILLADGIERASRLLASAKYPLVYGLAETTCESQRVAVGIADWIGGTVDTPTSHCHGPWGVAFQGVGEVTCSLGEIANRGDLVIFWGSNPVVSHPRHFSRYSLDPQGMFVPRGRADRTCVVVDVRETPSAQAADLFLRIDAGKDFEALWILRGLAQSIEFDPAEVQASTGAGLSAWQDLMARMKAAKFGVILFGMGLTASQGKHLNSEAMLALVRDMNAYTRFVAKPMRERGNIAGADNVLSWRTGYPFGVNLSRGYPRFNPGEYTAAEMLARGEVDAALIVASDPIAQLGAAAAKHLATIPTVVLADAPSATTRGAHIWFATATYGINTPGTVYRMDDVPIPLRPAIDSPRPSDYEVLSAIEARVCQLKGVRRDATTSESKFADPGQPARR